MRSRRQWLQSTAGAAALAAACPWVGASTPAAGGKVPRLGVVTIALTRPESFCQLPLHLAQQLGYFAQEGVRVEWLVLPDLEAVLAALAQGRAQVMSAPYATVLEAVARGSAWRSFVLQSRAPQHALGVSRRSMAHYRHPSDLRQRLIGVPVLGQEGHRVVGQFLWRAGLSVEQVRLVAVPDGQEAMYRLRVGALDALCYPDPVVTQLERDGHWRLLVDTRTVRGTVELFGAVLPSACLSASNSFLSEHPEQAEALTHALVHALKWLQTAGLLDVSRAVSELFFQGDRALYLEAFSRVREGWSPDGMMPEDGPRTTYRSLQGKAGGAAALPSPLVDSFTNDWVRQAKARFRA